MVKAMKELSVTLFPFPDMSVYLRKRPMKLVVDEPSDIENIPGRFVRFKKELDLTKIRQALEAGEDVSFARLEPQDVSITISTR